jgi:hypothetical protein
VIDPAILQTLLVTLRDARWGWTSGEVPRLATLLDWSLVETIDGKGAVADAGWNVGDEEIELSFTGERVNDITMRVTDTALPRSAQSQEFTQDAFAAVSAAATRLLGPPTSRIKGSHPQVRWRGDDTTISVTNTGPAVTIGWATNAYQDHWDRVQGVSA